LVVDSSSEDEELGEEELPLELVPMELGCDLLLRLILFLREPEAETLELVE
jgi:hypothetical protein